MWQRALRRERKNKAGVSFLSALSARRFWVYRFYNSLFFYLSQNHLKQSSVLAALILFDAKDLQLSVSLLEVVGDIKRGSKEWRWLNDVMERR